VKGKIGSETLVNLIGCEKNYAAVKGALHSAEIQSCRISCMRSIAMCLGNINNTIQLMYFVSKSLSFLFDNELCRQEMSKICCLEDIYCIAYSCLSPLLRARFFVWFA
jgi:hypothetical protein